MTSVSPFGADEAAPGAMLNLTLLAPLIQADLASSGHSTTERTQRRVMAEGDGSDRSVVGRLSARARILEYVLCPHRARRRVLLSSLRRLLVPPTRLLHAFELLRGVGLPLRPLLLFRVY